MKPVDYQVGQFYDVPTVLGELRNLKRAWPVMGPKHLAALNKVEEQIAATRKHISEMAAKASND